MHTYQNLISIGILVIFLGIFLIIFGIMKDHDKSNTKIAIGGFIGFIPFGLWSDESSKKYLLLGMGFIMILALAYLIYLNTKFQ